MPPNRKVVRCGMLTSAAVRLVSYRSRSCHLSLCGAGARIGTGDGEKARRENSPTRHSYIYISTVKIVIFKLSSVCYEFKTKLCVGGLMRVRRAWDQGGCARGFGVCRGVCKHVGALLMTILVLVVDTQFLCFQG